MLKKLWLSLAIFTILAAQAVIAPETTYAADLCEQYKQSNWECSSEGSLIALKPGANSGLATCPENFVKLSTANSFTCHLIPKELQNDQGIKQLTEASNTLVAFQEVFSRLLWPILEINGKLLDNSLFFEHGMEEVMLQVWRPIRDLVNIFVILGLIAIAVYNVFGISNEGNLAIKSALPKLIIAVIAINFSFFAIKVVLDVTNVVTTAIFSLPTEVGAHPDVSENPALVDGICMTRIGKDATNFKEDQELIDYLVLRDIKSRAEKGDIANLTPDLQKQVKKATKIEELTEDPFPKIKTETTEKVKNEKNCQFKPGDGNNQASYTFTDNGITFFSNFNSNNASLLMAVNLGKVVLYDNIDFSSDTFGKILVNSIFSTIFFFVYLISFLALFVVLVVRVIVIWVSMVLSPILLILLAAPELKSKLGGIGEFADEFTKNLFAPIQIGIAMSVGWIMLRAFQGITWQSEYGTASGIPIMGTSTIQDLIVALGTLAVIWKSAFAASKDTMAKGVVEFMENSTLGLGKWLASAPLKYGKFIPIKFGGQQQQNYTVSDLIGAGGALRDRNSSLLRGTDTLANALGLDVEPKDKSFKNADKKEYQRLLYEKLKANTFDKNDFKEFFKNEQNATATINAMNSRNKEIFNQLKELYDKDENKFDSKHKELLNKADLNDRIFNSAKEAAKKATTPANAASPDAENRPKHQPVTEARRADTINLNNINLDTYNGTQAVLDQLHTELNKEKGNINRNEIIKKLVELMKKKNRSSEELHKLVDGHKDDFYNAVLKPYEARIKQEGITDVDSLFKEALAKAKTQPTP